MNIEDALKSLKASVGLDLLQEFVEEVDKAHPELREAFENERKDEIFNEDLDKLYEEVEEIFKHDE